MSSRRLHTSLALIALATLTPGPWARPDAPAAAREDVERLSRWPELAKDEERTVDTDVARLRKARTPEMASEAREALVRVGAGVAPSLLAALGKEKDADARERIEDVLAAVTGAPHTRLLAKEFGDRSLEVRVWCMRRAAAFPDAGIRAQADAALGAARARRDKEKVDPEELYVASLVAASAGSVAGLDEVYDRALKDWKRAGREIRTATEAVRGPEATKLLAARLAEADDVQRVAVLHLLAGCGDRETAVKLVAPFLDSEHAQVRVAAINALRGIVDGAPPVDKLSAFDAIEMAKEWKARI